MSNPTVGFIGLGIMGKPMARNLLKAGYSPVVHNRSRTAVTEHYVITVVEPLFLHNYVRHGEQKIAPKIT